MEAKTHEQLLAEEWTRQHLGVEPVHVGQVIAERIVALHPELSEADERDR
jgi:hypothetical protein